MRRDIREGTLDHRKLEAHLEDAVNQLTAEVRKQAGELPDEANTEKNGFCPLCGRETRVNTAAAKIEIVTRQGAGVPIFTATCRTTGTA